MELARLSNGQVNGQSWIFQSTAGLTAADMVQALKNGRVFVSIESANFPGGELRGAFIQSSGSMTFTRDKPNTSGFTFYLRKRPTQCLSVVA